METVFLTLMIVGLIVVFTIDTTQKRRRFRDDGKKLNEKTYPHHK
ncbi:MAG TPA: hypothetical protein VFR47_07090 [Anaerolineales bacterium]|nr:hypothetical protein [Anaerolineales bacterium]